MTATGRRVRVAAAVVWRDGKLLLTQRPPGGAFALQWEFPGGKIEPGETPAQALTREVLEELGVAATAHEALGVSVHDYAEGPRVEVAFLRCTLDSYDFRPSPAAHAVRWASPAAIPPEMILEADREFLARLKAGA